MLFLHLTMLYASATPSVTQDLPSGSSIPGAQVAGANTSKVQLWCPPCFARSFPSQRSRSVALHIPVAAGSRSLVAKGGENMRTQRMLARLLEGKKAPAAGAWGLVGTI